jgi:hypothetical protein
VSELILSCTERYLSALFAAHSMTAPKDAHHNTESCYI